MAWHYVKNGQQVGPVEDAAFAELRRNGTVGPDTLIWNATMTEWVPCSRIYPVATSQPAAVGGAAGGTSTCRECGRQFPSDQVVPLADGFVCASCKPMALRKLQEGIATSGTSEYAGFWIRLGAKMIDGIVVGGPFTALFLVLFFSLGFSDKAKQDDPVFLALIGACFFCIFAVTVLYDTVLVGKYGATLGKKAVGIMVIRSDDSPLTYGRAFGRACANQIPNLGNLLCSCFGIIFSIAYVIAAFDDQKRTLFDHICDTRVVYKR